MFNIVCYKSYLHSSILVYSSVKFLKLFFLNLVWFRLSRHKAFTKPTYQTISFSFMLSILNLRINLNLTFQIRWILFFVIVHICICIITIYIGFSYFVLIFAIWFYPFAHCFLIILIQFRINVFKLYNRLDI